MANLSGNEGASLERQAWMAKVKRLRLGDGTEVAGAPFSNGFNEALRLLLKFGEGRAKRNAAKPGSLGRKKK